MSIISKDLERGPYTPFDEVIRGEVGNNRKNDEWDVKVIREKLGRINYRTDEDKAEGIFTRPLDSAIKTFQADEKLTQDGWLRPGGPTEERLNKRLKQSAAPEGTPLASTILPKMYDDEIVPTIGGWEGEKPKFYLDDLGNPTIGTGFMVPNAERAKTYPLYKMDGKDFSRPATPQEIESAFAKVKAMPFGKNMPYEEFEKVTDVGMKLEDMRPRFKQKLRVSIDELRNKFDGFDDLPAGVQFGLLDMQYNMGDEKFQRKYKDKKTGEEKGWPQFLDAYNIRDFQEMAKQSHRTGIQDDRNEGVYDSFFRAK